jgi:DNA-binding NarL/FixJ family response regulator
MHDENKSTVMIVEDNIPLLNYMAEKLQEKYNIHFALNGWEALEKLKTIKHLDLLVSDVMMDRGNGFELYQDISSQSKFNHIPVIFLTAKATMEDKMQGLEMGAIDYIFKPFLISELTGKIDSVLKNLSQQRKALINHAYNSLFNDRYEPKEISTNLNKFEDNCNKFRITNREKEIIKLIKIGQTYKEIGDNLCISDKTVAKHVQNIFEKVNVTNKLELLDKLEAPLPV